MPDNKKIISNIGYKAWVTDIKTRLRTAQLKAAVSVNTELLKFYWELGADIVEKQKTAKWGSGFLQQLSNDLKAEFPDLKGFSYRNIRAIRQWYLFYNKEDRKMAATCSQNWQQAVAKLTQIPWGHNTVIISRCDNTAEALYYVEKVIENSWSMAESNRLLARTHCQAKLLHYRYRPPSKNKQRRTDNRYLDMQEQRQDRRKIRPE